MAGKRMATMRTVFHDVGRYQKAILTSAPSRRKDPYNIVRITTLTDRQIQMYKLFRIEEKGLDDLMGRTEYDWEEFSEVALTKMLDKSLKMAISTRQAKTVEFNISPGKLTFQGHHYFGPPFLFVEGLVSTGPTLSSSYLLVDMGLPLHLFPAYVVRTRLSSSL